MRSERRFRDKSGEFVARAGSDYPGNKRYGGLYMRYGAEIEACALSSMIYSYDYNLEITRRRLNIF